MSTVPPKLAELQKFLKTRTKLSPVSLGVVGNAKHKSGYHLGKDRIFLAGGQGADDYSIQTARDKTGLSDESSAMDIGSFDGLRRMGRWIVREARKNTEDTRDIREVIYSPDGITVLRWDRENGLKSFGHKGEADDSHRTHTHVSWYRDSLKRDKTAIFVRFFDLPKNAKTATSAAGVKSTKAGAPPVKTFNVPIVPTICTVPTGARLFSTSDLTDVAFNIDPGRDMPFLGQPVKGVALIHRTDEQGNLTGLALFARMQDVKNIRRA